MGRNFVNLNINPCKACMPLGAVMALKGIEGCMTIIHGSQGCSTYIRRHMATHFNEPIDIASSSLSEHGTVYGGEENLKSGIKNLVQLYNPKLIAVTTTCLAETIGEDIQRIVDDLSKEELGSDVKIVTISTAGYSGTQYDGHFKALRRLVESIEGDATPNEKINIVVHGMSPGDIRHLKDIINKIGIGAIIFPDISETLDAPHVATYSRIAKGGTNLEDISKMAGAKATVEIGIFADEKYSVGKYLFDNYNVPFYKCAIPIGLKNTDGFIETLIKISGKEIPIEIKKDRGRFLDAMIDSHKHNGEGSAVIYGEPDQCYSLAKLCCENGILPALVAVGNKCSVLKELLQDDIDSLCKKADTQKTLIIDDIDFETIERYARELGANILIGNSDGRRIEERMNIKLVRIGFPIHDRIGGQRQISIGYFGSNLLLDKITNTLIEKIEGGFRKELFNKYYKNNSESKMHMNDLSNENLQDIALKRTMEHPCYNCGASGNARMHLPIAPKCNISCNYCSRKFDCPNESRPGVTSEILSPEAAFEKFVAVKSKLPNLKVIGIAGPGDALANFAQTKQTLELIRKYDKDITFCLSTNGLMLPFYADALIKIGVTHITVTINAIDENIGAKIYKRVSYLGKNYNGADGARILRDNQLSGLTYLASRGVVCKVNIVLIKGINDHHVQEVVKKVKECGCYITNIMQMIPVQDSAFCNLPLVSNIELEKIRDEASQYISQMRHCRQCRADAIGTLDKDESIAFRTSCSEAKAEARGKYRFAISSKSGMLVDMHFGHCEEFYIYDYLEGKVVLVEKRHLAKYCNGKLDCEDKEQKNIATFELIKDCDAVITSRIGYSPQKHIEDMGKKVFAVYEEIEKAVIIAANEIDSLDSIESKLI